MLLVNALAQLWEKLKLLFALKCQLSHCMMLNIHKEGLGELSLIKIGNVFCRKNEARLNTFWNFIRSRFLSILSWRGQWQYRLSNIFHCFLLLTFFWQSTTVKLLWTFGRTFYSFAVLEITISAKDAHKKT